MSLFILILTFFVFLCTIWIFLYSVKPSFVCLTGDNGEIIDPTEPDAGTCLFVAIIGSLIIAIILYFAGSFNQIELK